jgi:hypothetical protein
MKNRKRAETYRFNGSLNFDARSIRSVGIDQLQAAVSALRRKLDDPKDEDDKRWTARWLSRYEKELAKKERALETKGRESANESSRRRRGTA